MSIVQEFAQSAFVIKAARAVLKGIEVRDGEQVYIVYLAFIHS